MGYMYLGTAYDPNLPPNATWKLCNVIVLQEGTNRKVLEEKPLGPIDETIKWAIPLVFEGPGVFEQY